MKQASVLKTVRFNDDLYNRINDKAKSLGVSFSAAVRIILEAGLKGNIATVDDEIVSGSSNVAMKSAIMALAKAVGDDNVIDEIATYLGEDTEMLPKEEIRKTPTKQRKKSVNSEKSSKPLRTEISKTQDVLDETSTKMQKPATLIPSEKPVIEKPPTSIAQEGIPAEPTEEENDYESIDVSADTDVTFPADMMSDLNKMIGLDV